MNVLIWYRNNVFNEIGKEESENLRILDLTIIFVGCGPYLKLQYNLKIYVHNLWWEKQGMTSNYPENFIFISTYSISITGSSLKTSVEITFKVSAEFFWISFILENQYPLSMFLVEWTKKKSHEVISGKYLKWLQMLTQFLGKKIVNFECTIVLMKQLKGPTELIEFVLADGIGFILFRHS